MLLELALSLPRDERSVPVARHVVRASMHAIGVDQGCTHDVEVALSEACTNVLRHGAPAAEYEVRLRLTGELCVLRVIEVGNGHGAGPWSVPPVVTLAGDAEHGRGLFLMRALVDRVGFRLAQGSGAAVLLEKRLVYATDGRRGREPDRR